VYYAINRSITDLYIETKSEAPLMHNAQQPSSFNIQETEN